MASVDLSALPLSYRPLRRFTQLFAGLALYGASMGLMVRAGLGLDPWDVLHEGLTTRIGLSFGTVTAITGLVVLLAWLPLRQVPGIGTVANVVVIALAVDATLALLPEVTVLWAQVVAMVASVVLNGLACAVYVGARLGPGPRDGLMTGLAARTGASIRLVRTGIELSVLVLGWLLGGTVGVGTVLYALGIGPAVQFFLPSVALRAPTRVQTAS
ncbi:membrane protein YczE [Allokutzneria oryzae]|uniref:YitT family protein n=1 Tax=Allokutzneria oryzae TaxID=1378989 RepID=A0ABV5ZXN6_9PSEU